MIQVKICSFLAHSSSIRIILTWIKSYIPLVMPWFKLKHVRLGDHSKLNLNLNHSYPPLVMSWFKLKYVRFVRLNRSFIVILTCGMPWFKLKYIRFWLQLNQSHFNLNLFVHPSGYAMIQVKFCSFWIYSDSIWVILTWIIPRLCYDSS